MEINQRNIIETLGSMSYGVALAFIELFSNNPGCVYICRSYINELIRRLNRITYFPVPDLDAYNLVKDLFSKGVIPFESTINIDYDTYREIREKIDLVVDSRLHKIFDELGIYRIEQDVEAEITHLSDGIYIKFLLSKLNNVVIPFYILYEDEPKLYMNISASFSDDIDRVIDVIRNWYSYVVKAIEKSIEKLDSLRIKKNINKQKRISRDKRCNL